MSKENIQVAIRIRPPLPREIESNQFKSCVAIGQNIVQQKGQTAQKVFVSLEDRPVVISEDLGQGEAVVEGNVAAYTFNRVFGPESVQEQLFDSVVQESTQAVKVGINATIFAYGQTGTGKTYTMMGDEKDPFNEGTSGMIPRAIQSIFNEAMLEESVEEVVSGGLEEEKFEDPGQASQQTDYTNFYSVTSQESSGFEYLEEEKREDPGYDSDETVNTDISEIEIKNSVFISVLQIYNESVSDLLQAEERGNDQNLKVRLDQSKNFYVQDLRHVEVSSPQQTLQLLRKALKNRVSRSQEMNEVSSRSHLIVTLTINSVDHSDMSVSSAKLNLVDLAGSERVKDSQVTGQALKEATYINKSLMTLSHIVSSLEKGTKSGITFRDSKLTMLLKDSIGGNCKTSLVACLSPSQSFCRESNNTLMFAHSCKQIQNITKVNKYRGSIPASTPVVRKQASNVSRDAPWKGQHPDIESIDLQLRAPFNKIHVKCAGNPERMDRAVVFIHGCDKSSSGTQFQHWFTALVHFDFRVVAIDMPGYGKSSGKKQSFRTRNILDQDGPADVITEVIKELGLVKPALFGYDWGGSIAMRFGIRAPQVISKVISFMPAYGPPPGDENELKRLKTPTLVWWISGDALHVWPKFKQHAAKIPGVEIDIQKTPNWKAPMAVNTYAQLSNTLSARLIKFLTGIDPLQPVQVMQEALESSMKAVGGKTVKAKENLILGSQVNREDLEKVAKQPDLESAIKFFKDQFNVVIDLEEIRRKASKNMKSIGSQKSQLVTQLLKKLKLSREQVNNDPWVLRRYNIIKDALLGFKPEPDESFQMDQAYFDSFLNDGQIEETYISTPYGEIHTFFWIAEKFGKPCKNVILSMHGDGATSDNTGWIPILKPFAEAGYTIYSHSMPGYGKSTGDRHSFRSSGVQVIFEIMKALSLEKIIVLGRSVGGRTSIEFGSHFPNETVAAILQHPVVPGEAVIRNLRVPTILSWAKDDGEWSNKRGHPNAGHPYFGPNGAQYIVSLTGCDLLTWEESDYSRGPAEFFETTFCDEVISFLNTHKI